MKEKIDKDFVTQRRYYFGHVPLRKELFWLVWLINIFTLHITLLKE